MVPSAQLRSAKTNMQSAMENPTVIQDYLEKETAAGNILGPFRQDDFPDDVHINRFGVIPKKH